MGSEMGSEMVRSLASHWVTDLGSLWEIPSGLQKEYSLGSMLGKGKARPWEMLKGQKKVLSMALLTKNPFIKKNT